MEFLQWLQEKWVYIVSLASSLGLSTILTILAGIWNASRTKKLVVGYLTKFTAENTVETTTKLICERLKSISITQNIQPIVQSEIVKARETVSADFKDELKKTREADKNVVLCLKAFAQYFDNAYGVPEEVKEAFNQAINKALADTESNENIELKVIVEEPTKEPEKTEITAQTTTKASR